MKILMPFLLFACCSLHAAERMPDDVRIFVEKREACDHFRGELPEPEDVARMREVNHQLDNFCRGTDARLARLKKKYADDSAVLKRLNEYEERIESKRSSY